MQIPLSWLKEFVDINIPVEELAERLTAAGLEVGHLHYYGLPQTHVEGIRWPVSNHLVWDRQKLLLGAILVTMALLDPRSVPACPAAPKIIAPPGVSVSAPVLVNVVEAPSSAISVSAIDTSPFASRVPARVSPPPEVKSVPAAPIFRIRLVFKSRFAVMTSISSGVASLNSILPAPDSPI